MAWAGFSARYGANGAAFRSRGITGRQRRVELEMVLSPEEGREMREFLCENGYCVIPGVRHSPRPNVHFMSHPALASGRG